jgi:folate-binding protein YgfZ
MPIAYLNDRAVIRIAGPEAAPFLQNVLTLDLAGVDTHGSGYGALLSPQGKILWDFILHKLGDGYVADLRADAAEAFAKRLALYKLRAKVEIGPADLAVFAAWLDSSSHPADPRLADLGARWLAPAGSVAADAALADWHQHRVALGIPEGGIDFVFGDTFPHDAAMDSLRGVAFEKGCYIGQEVVSRMRHRGTARRRIVAVAGDSDLPAPGADIMAGDRSVGRLGSSAQGSGIALVRLDRVREALDARVQLKAGTAPISVNLPPWATYSWPATAMAGDD